MVEVSPHLKETKFRTDKLINLELYLDYCSHCSVIRIQTHLPILKQHDCLARTSASIIGKSVKLLRLAGQQTNCLSVGLIMKALSTELNSDIHDYFPGSVCLNFVLNCLFIIVTGCSWKFCWPLLYYLYDFNIPLLWYYSLCYSLIQVRIHIISCITVSKLVGSRCNLKYFIHFMVDTSVHLPKQVTLCWNFLDG